MRILNDMRVMDRVNTLEDSSAVILVQIFCEFLLLCSGQRLVKNVTNISCEISLIRALGCDEQLTVLGRVGRNHRKESVRLDICAHREHKILAQASHFSFRTLSNIEKLVVRTCNNLIIIFYKKSACFNINIIPCLVEKALV